MTREGREEGRPERDGEPPEPAPVLRFDTRRVERRLPGVGPTRFRAPAAVAEEALAPHAAAGDARAFANTLIAASIDEPAVTAADVDGWSERTRAIARVASADVIGCLPQYRRLAGSGKSGDERLLAAMHARDEELRRRLAAAAAAFRGNVVRLGDAARLAHRPGVVESMLRHQRAFDRMARPAVVEQMLRLNKQMEQMFRPSYLAQVEQLNRQVESMRRLVVPNMSQLSEQFTTANRVLSSFSGNSALRAAIRTYTDMSGGLARQMTMFARPRYFGALLDVGRLGLTPTKLAEMAGIGRHLRSPHLATISRLAEQLRRPPWLDSLREAMRGPLEAYVAWIEREWSELKSRKTPAPVTFLLASLPAIVALPLLRALETDDELLLARLELELRGGRLVDELQQTVQASAVLDGVAKQHLVRALDWIQRAQYVDAAPPLYQGLERAFRLTARDRQVIDGNNCFLVAARRRRMRTIDDVLPHLGLDHLFVRFLRAWVFGELGNLARHGDLDEEEHRRWVLRAVLAVVGWVEYVGGRADAVGKLVERLELEAPDEADAG